MTRFVVELVQALLGAVLIFLILFVVGAAIGVVAIGFRWMAG